ncbi:MAG: GAF domain-containing sensor histidine kinase [Magnetococcales bacterium]|nr:GAF domain-containing sensor histidine kinase [Magnetococcales bacterium]
MSDSLPDEASVIDSENFWQRYPGLLVSILVVTLFLLLQGMLVITEQRKNLNQLHQERIQHELNLMSMVAYESIFKGDYAILERVLTQWGEGNKELTAIRAIAPNGFVLAEYRARDKVTATESHSRQLQNRGEPVLRIEIEYSLDRITLDVNRLSIQLGLVSALLMILLGVLLWAVLRITAVRPLEQEILKRRQAEEASRRVSQIHSAVNEILRITLQSAPLARQFQLVLDKLLAIPWLSVETKGSIYLADEKQQYLTMIVERGLDPELLQSCRQIPFGYCLCGQAAHQKAFLCASHVDERHTTRSPGMRDHGHYCVPILTRNRVLGVINLYVEPGHDFTPEKQSFLLAVADTLEGLIRRHQSEDALQHLNEELEQRVERRTLELRASLESLQQARDRLHQSEKMASLGRLVAGVAHEINTPVGIGYTAASFLEDRTRQTAALFQNKELRSDDLKSYLESANEASHMILTNLERAAHLIRSFKQVAVDHSANALRRFDLVEHLQLIVTSLRPKIKPTRHQLLLETPPFLEIHNHPGALFQILTNLVMNSLIHAFDAIQEGQITLTVTLDSDDTVMLSYRDNGKGIEESDRKKIFEPFFTTRLGQGGSGLGMYIVYNLVTQCMGGSISCQNAADRGIEFMICFPKNFQPVTPS